MQIVGMVVRKNEEVQNWRGIEEGVLVGIARMILLTSKGETGR